MQACRVHSQKSSIVRSRSELRCSFIPGGSIGSPLSSATYPKVAWPISQISSNKQKLHPRKGISIDSFSLNTIVGKSCSYQLPELEHLLGLGPTV
jgi:hypothetical protein